MNVERPSDEGFFKLAGPAHSQRQHSEGYLKADTRQEIATARRLEEIRLSVTSNVTFLKALRSKRKALRLYDVELASVV